MTVFDLTDDSPTIFHTCCSCDLVVSSTSGFLLCLSSSEYHECTLWNPYIWPCSVSSQRRHFRIGEIMMIWTWPSQSRFRDPASPHFSFHQATSRSILANAAAFLHQHFVLARIKFDNVPAENVRLQRWRLFHAGGENKEYYDRESSIKTQFWRARNIPYVLSSRTQTTQLYTSNTMNNMSNLAETLTASGGVESVGTFSWFHIHPRAYRAHMRNHQDSSTTS